MAKSRTKRPSRAITNGTLTGVGLTPLIVWGLQAAGVPLPTDPMQAAVVGGALGNLVTGALGWITRGGRKGEAD